MPADATELDPPDPDSVYRGYLRKCKKLGVLPVPRDRARKLIEEWVDTLAAAKARPPTTH